MKKLFKSTDELYRGASLIPLNIDAVDQRIYILSGYLREELDKKLDGSTSEINSLHKSIEFWKMMRETQCQKPTVKSASENFQRLDIIDKSTVTSLCETVGNWLKMLKTKGIFLIKGQRKKDAKDAINS